MYLSQISLEINPMYHVKISLQNKRTLKERLIKVRPQPATPTTRRAISVAASGAKAPAIDEEIHWSVCHIRGTTCQGLKPLRREEIRWSVCHIRGTTYQGLKPLRCKEIY